MAQSARDSRLETRSARLRLKVKLRHYKAIGSGLTLIYRRTGEGYGTWTAKLALPRGKYALRAIGAADDYQDANGADVLNFHQAQDKARGLSDTVKIDGGIVMKPDRVKDAADRYLTWFRQHRKSIKETEHNIRVHIAPALGDHLIHSLTARDIRAWHEKLASRPARLRTGRLSKKPNLRAPAKTDDEKRARRATANRILSVLKAILNRAFQDGRVRDDTAWRQVRPFPKADEARIRFLTDAEGLRLVNASPTDLRALIRGALLTGARHGELAAMRAHDVNLSTRQVYIAQSKSGRPRFVPLNPEGVNLFRDLLAGKTGDALVFTRKDGNPWGKNHHVRALQEACGKAKIKPQIAFHELRHTYASHLAQAGVDLLTISKLLGHADTRMTSKHYAHLADTTLARAVTKLPSFGTSNPPKVRAIQ
ncbi:MAG: site-specific integrase [Burkholderiales bacterium]|jgi:integrase|nr:site-specific integrase [Burkholderiales bacterium]